MKWIRYSYLLTFFGIAYLFYRFVQSDNFTGGGLHFPVLMALIAIPAPYLLQAIYFQHSSMKARHLSQQIYDKAINEFVDSNIYILYSAKDCRNETEKRMLSGLQHAAKMYSCDVMVSIIAADKHHLTAVKQSSKLLNVVMTTKTLEHYEPQTLSHIIACMMVLHDIGSDHGDNSPEEALPIQGYAANTPANPLVIAVMVFENASEKLKQVDHVFQFSGSTSVITRARQLGNILARENGDWLK